MGGMAAQIPVKNDEEANTISFNKVTADKEREAKDGHDGTWVAHPGLVKTAMDVFNKYMKEKNQIHSKRHDVNVTAMDLLAVPEDKITEEGFRTNINVGILYIESWLRGVGAAALYNLMEDAATAEISRTQVWQWIHRNSKLDDGREINEELLRKILPEEVEKIKLYVGEKNFTTGKFIQAINLFTDLALQEKYTDFLTLPAYEQLNGTL
jgi:malate synthase